MAEAANLLIVPGRLCSNGKPVPMQNADWQMFVKGLRDAGMATYKAGQSKNMDAVVEVSDRGGGTVRLPNSPWRFSDGASGVRPNAWPAT